MNVSRMVYRRLPAPLKPPARRLYHRISDQPTAEERHQRFIAQFFAGQAEYESIVSGFRSEFAERADDRGLYEQLTSNSGLGGVSLQTCAYQYALVRSLEPESVVETGVCNGLSTLAILLALEENDDGHLYSVDLPLRADETLEELLRFAGEPPETFYAEIAGRYDHAIIPADQDPGWIIPSDLRDRWTLELGKSQRRLPSLVAGAEPIDIFVHDSEHSLPCMLFEYELAWEHLGEGGILLSDDVNLTDAFPAFTGHVKGVHGRLPNDIGWIVRDHRSE